MTTTRWEFCNEKFQKGKKELLCEIRRRKAWANRQQQAAVQAGPGRQDHRMSDNVVDEDQRSSSASSLSEYSNLVDENKRLKKENGALSSELLSMKNRCKELLDLVSKYAVDNHNLHHNRAGEGSIITEEEGGDREEEKGPKLFGVRLGERDDTRKRKGESLREMPLPRT